MVELTSEIIGWAQDAERVYQIPAALNIAAAMVESELGLHTPPGTNNWHGIKDPANTSETATKEQRPDGTWYTIEAGFKIFPNPAGSFMGYGKLLGLGEPYRAAVTTYLATPRAPADVETLTRAIAVRYATALSYATALITAEEKNNLFSTDILPPVVTPISPAPTPTIPAPAPVLPPIAPGAGPSVAPQGTFNMLTAILGLLGSAPQLIGDGEAAFAALTAFIASPAGVDLENSLATLFHTQITTSGVAIAQPKIITVK